MQENKVLVKGIEVHYKVFGQGKPMLILHGWGSNSGRWQKVAELLAEIHSKKSGQENIQTIIPDLPGFGATPEPPMAWNLDNYVEWVKEFSEKTPELNKGFYLLGHSFGGSVSVKFAIKYNQKVQKLFLVSAACLRKPTLSKKILYRVSKVVKVFSFLPYYQLARKVFYKFIIRKSDYLYVKEGTMKETYMKTISEDLSHRLRFVTVPTIIIWGDKDNLTPFSDANVIHGKIQDSTLIILPNVKHSLQIEMPEILAEKILENLANVSYNEQLLSLKNII